MTIEEVERGLAGVKAEKEILFTPPVAILIRYVHPRMAAQRSRFTVHGRKKDSLSELVPSDILRLYKIDPRCRDCLKRDLRMLGVDRATAFQDLEGLARELTARYAPGLLE